MAFVDGIKKLIGLEPLNELFRGAVTVRDSRGETSICLLIRDKNKLASAQRRLAKHGVPMVTEKIGIDGFPVLKITVNDARALAAPARRFLDGLYKTVSTRQTPQPTHTR